MNILFHCVHDTISLAMYEDLAIALKEDGHDIRFQFAGGASMPYCLTFISANDFTIYAPSLLNWKPDVMFVADFRCYERPTPDCTVIDLGHGIGSKAAYYSQTTDYQSEYVITPSEWLANKIRRPGKTQFVACGMPKLDRAVRIRDERKRDGISNAFPHVLVAPTHNEEYNCLAMIKENLAGLTQSFDVIVKPHEYFYTDPKLAHWKARLETPPEGVRVVRDANIADLLGVADVVVSDVSSVFMEAIGIGIPTVICESAAMIAEAQKEPDLPQYEWRNEFYFRHAANETIRDGSHLESAVTSALRTPLGGSWTSALRGKMLSYPGRAIENVKALLADIASSRQTS